MIFRRKARRTDDLRSLDGVVTFFSSHHALKAEHVLKGSHRRAVLIPGPREISPNCGTALRFEYAEKDAVCELFRQRCVQYEEMHYLSYTIQPNIMNTRQNARYLQPWVFGIIAGALVVLAEVVVKLAPPSAYAVYLSCHPSDRVT